MRILSWIVGALLGASALFQADGAFGADDVVGSVLALRGDVFSTTDAGSPQALTVNAAVHLGDTIVAATGKAKIALSDGTVISVGENSRVRIADYQRTPIGNARVQLLSGALRALVTKASPGGRFEIETETAVAAVRGTDWVIEATPEQTAVAVVSGTVAVSGRGSQAQATVVLNEPGQGTDVRRGAAPTPAARWGTQRFDATLARATFE